MMFVSNRTLAGIAIAGPILFAAAVLFQDVVQYDYLVAHGNDPRTTSPVSINELGPYGWIQELNFAAIGLAVIALAVAAHHGIHGPGRSVLGPALIGLWGVEWLLGMSPIERHIHSPSGFIHALSFVSLSVTPVPMYFLMWRRIRGSLGWERMARYTLVMAVLTIPLWVATLTLPKLVPFSWFYVWIAAVLLWPVLVGLRLRRA
jgi:Protein of unknown function (DUF998)